MDASQLAEENAIGNSSMPLSEDPQKDIIQNLIETLETLTLNLVQALGGVQREEGRAPRCQPQEFKCWNCLEIAHGMYHFPYPRRNLGDIYPPGCPPQIVQNEQPQQFLCCQQEPLPQHVPQDVANIPPLPPNDVEERGVHVIKLESSSSGSL